MGTIKRVSPSIHFWNSTWPSSHSPVPLHRRSNKVLHSIDCMKSIHRTGREVDFIREVQMLSQCAHPNIIGLVRVVEAQRRPWFPKPQRQHPTPMPRPLVPLQATFSLLETAKQESRGRGVANLIQNCVKLFNSAKAPQGGPNPQVVLSSQILSSKGHWFRNRSIFVMVIFRRESIG